MEPFLGQIMMVGFNFAPRGWAMCQGQLLSIAQNSALFSLLGTTYGGDGRVTFALPDLRGRCAVGTGQGPGLSDRTQGEMFGQESVTLTIAETPSHIHQLLGSNTDGTASDPTNNALAKSSVTIERGASPIPVSTYTSEAPNVAMAGSSVAPAGGNQPHNNVQPSIAMNYIIALEGIYPSRP